MTSFSQTTGDQDNSLDRMRLRKWIVPLAEWHLSALNRETDSTVLRLLDRGLPYNQRINIIVKTTWQSCLPPVDHLPSSSVRCLVPGPVHRHLDGVLEDSGAESAGDAGGGPQGGRGVDLQQPGPQVIGQHEVGAIELIAVLAGTAALHHICHSCK